MSISKNFVVKNGVEVSTNLIYAESSIDKVGIGTTTPNAKLDVIGNIVGVGLTLSGSITGTNANYSGIVTSSTGLEVGVGGTIITVDVTNNSTGFNSTTPDTNYVLDVQPGAGQSAATFGAGVDIGGPTTIDGDLTVSGAIDGSFTVNLDNPVITGVVTANNAEIFTQFDIVNNSNVAYQYKSTGIGFTQNTDNPVLVINRGQKYHFNLNASGHPFYIKTDNTTGTGDQYTAGVTNNGAQVGVVTFYVPYNAPAELYYQCGAYSGMGNTMYVLKDPPVGLTTTTPLSIADLYVTGISTIIGNAEFQSDIILGDSDKAIFGADGDLEIYHDGGNNYVAATSGSLFIRGSDLVLEDAGGNDYITCSDGGSGGTVTLNHLGNTKLETTNTGVTITGTTTSSGGFSGNVTGNADSATTTTNITVTDESADTSCNVLFVTSTTGDLPPKSGTNLTFNSSTGELSATTFNGSLSGTATNATNITLADNSSDTTCFPLFATSATGNQAPKTDASALTYNASTGQLTVVDLNTTSDINLKKDIDLITNATDLIKQLNGVRFTWKVNDRKSLGVIAQEVEELFPELISERTDTGTKSVNYNGLVGVLIEAVKELSTRVEELEKKQL